MSDEKVVFNAEPGTQVGTSIDADGGATVIDFDKDTGELETSDPGFIALLNDLADNPAVPIHRGRSRRKAAVEARQNEDEE